MNAFYRCFGKRFLDIMVSFGMLLAVLPLLAVISFAVGISLGRPVFFTQERVGRFGRIFRIVKFRSMTNERDQHGNLLPDSQRMTRFGSFIRQTSLDELPSIWNVLIGDMSFVGPRPLLTQYLSRYTPRQNMRHLVQPGITGLAQVKGRNLLDWERRFELDVEYVEQINLALDAKILWETIGRVLSRHGISQQNHVTMTEFHGVKSIYVIGAGGHAKVVISTLRKLGYFIEGVFDDDPSKWDQLFCGIKVLGPLTSIKDFPSHQATIAVGNNLIRRQIAKTICLPWATIIHPNASVDDSAEIGEGCQIMDGAIVQADAKIASHVIVNTGATIDHDCIVGDFVHIGPGCRLCGNVRVGAGSLMGVGSNVTPGVSIGEQTTVGAGAVVVKNLANDVTAIGVPAAVRPLRRAA